MDPNLREGIQSMKHDKEADQADNLKDPNAFSAVDISLMTVGVVSAFALVAFLLVLYKKMRKPKSIPEHSFTPTVVTSDGRDFGSKGNALLSNKSNRDNEIPRILTFIPMDVYVDHSSDNGLCDFMPEQGLNTVSSSHTTFTGKPNPFSCQFSDFVTSEGGEVLSPSSDVSLIIPRNSIPVGRIQQVFVNVTDDVSSAFRYEGKSCATPLVECLAPGLKTLLVPVILRMPIRSHGRNIRVYWSQSLGEHDVSGWLTVPREHVDCHVQQLMSYTIDAGYLCIKTYHMESFTCYASVQ